MERERIGKRLKELREKCGYTIGEAAAASGVEYPQINGAERGRSFMRTDLLQSLLAAYGLTVGQFFTELESGHPAPGPQIPARDRELVKTVVDSLKIKERRQVLVALCNQWRSADERVDKGGKA